MLVHGSGLRDIERAAIGDQSTTLVAKDDNQLVLLVPNALQELLVRVGELPVVLYATDGRKIQRLLVTGRGSAEGHETESDKREK